MIKKRLSDEKPRLLRRFLEWSIFYGVVFVKTFTVFLDAAIQYKVSIFQRLIVNQPVHAAQSKRLSEISFSTAIQSTEIMLPSPKSISTQAVSILNLQETMLLMAIFSMI